MNSRSRRLYARRARIFLATVFAAVFLPSTAPAIFHNWQIRELYTNLDGSVQFIEIFTTSAGQQSTGGATIQVTEQATGMTHTFTFPTNTGTPTNNHAVLIATASVGTSGGPTPDFFLPVNFLFSDASSIIFNGTLQGTVSYTSLPTNGTQSLAIPSLTAQPNSPQNFAGNIGSVPEPMTWGLVGAGGLAMCLLFRRRMGRG